jgi:hypothetical protein|tara:strand:+ start:817 stop:1122 length:306 start_codon:yes stop_codon:yes gene_type:complete
VPRDHVHVQLWDLIAKRRDVDFIRVVDLLQGSCHRVYLVHHRFPTATRDVVQVAKVLDTRYEDAPWVPAIVHEQQIAGIEPGNQVAVGGELWMQVERHGFD